MKVLCCVCFVVRVCGILIVSTCMCELLSIAHMQYITCNVSATNTAHTKHWPRQTICSGLVIARTPGLTCLRLYRNNRPARAREERASACKRAAAVASALTLAVWRPSYVCFYLSNTVHPNARRHSTSTGTAHNISLIDGRYCYVCCDALYICKHKPTHARETYKDRSYEPVRKFRAVTRKRLVYFCVYQCAFSCLFFCTTVFFL